MFRIGKLVINVPTEVISRRGRRGTEHDFLLNALHFAKRREWKRFSRAVLRLSLSLVIALSRASNARSFPILLFCHDSAVRRRHPHFVAAWGTSSPGGCLKSIARKSHYFFKLPISPASSAIALDRGQTFPPHKGS
jgi:hypothetical protein